MKYYLISWTAEDRDGQTFSGNATMEWNIENPDDQLIINNLKAKEPKLAAYTLTLQDKLCFNSREELERYSSR